MGSSDNGFPNAVLVAVWAKVVERRISDFNAQEPANTAWASAAADSPTAVPLAVLAKAASRRIGDFNVQEFVNTAGASSDSGPRKCSAVCDVGQGS